MFRGRRGALNLNLASRTLTFRSALMIVVRGEWCRCRGRLIILATAMLALVLKSAKSQVQSGIALVPADAARVPQQTDLDSRGLARAPLALADGSSAKGCWTRFRSTGSGAGRSQHTRSLASTSPLLAQEARHRHRWGAAIGRSESGGDIDIAAHQGDFTRGAVECIALIEVGAGTQQHLGCT